LPCRPPGADERVDKFTGNDTMGVADNNMTKSIHAFVHFSYIVSKSHLVFCDLQGMKIVTHVQTLIHSPSSNTGLPDENGVMCLFDPQVHTSVIFVFNVSPELIHTLPQKY